MQLHDFFSILCIVFASASLTWCNNNNDMEKNELKVEKKVRGLQFENVKYHSDPDSIENYQSEEKWRLITKMARYNECNNNNNNKQQRTRNLPSKRCYNEN